MPSEGVRRVEGKLYKIRVAGQLGADWRGWFEGLQIGRESEGETTLSGQLDQAALHGVLAKIRDLGLELVAVQRVRPRRQMSAESEQCAIKRAVDGDRPDPGEEAHRNDNVGRKVSEHGRNTD
jgi:hypothetical protein